MKPLVLITRPEEDAVETAAAVDRLGFHAVCVPVLKINYTDSALPEAAQAQGLIFSSANGVRAFLRDDLAFTFFEKPVFVVGDHTAEIARQGGFTDVRSASGAMKDLVALIRKDMVPPARLLHIRGRDVRENPAILLPRFEGWVIDGIVLYAAETVTTITLPDGPIAAALFYSARSAEAFTKAVPEGRLRGAKALCLSQSVLESLKQEQWAEICVSRHPDQTSMMELVQGLSHKAKAVQMNRNTPANTDDSDALVPAEAIIERFGGIRPMANKMDVPVTTVQGWKKRNVIPGNRRIDVLQSARRHNVDLSDLDAKNHNQNEPSFVNSLHQARHEEKNNPALDQIHQQAITGSPVMYDDFIHEMKKSETVTVRKSVLAATMLLSIFAIIVGLLFAIGHDKMRRDEARITVLEELSADAPKGSGFVTALATELRGRMGAIETSVDVIKTQAQSVVGSDNFSAISERLGIIEQKLQNMTSANPDLSAVVSKLQNPEDLSGAVDDLKNLISGLQGRVDQMDVELAKEQAANTALGQALEGVSPKELKAAAMLIGLTQFRQSLNRSEPFADDLAMMQSLSGDNDPELLEAIAKLSPYAEKGVLSPTGLSNELKGLTGDIIVSSISGDDVSVQEKAIARFQNLVSIKKDGQTVIGNDTQSHVSAAQKFFEEGRVDEALKELQSLQGPARIKAQPVIDQAQVTILAHQVQGVLSKSIMAQIKGIVRPVPLTTQGPASIMGPFMDTRPIQKVQ